MEYSKQVKAFARELGESGDKPLGDLSVILDHLGVEKVKELVATAKEINTKDGQMTLDGARRRTLGGVFFRLARPYLPFTPPREPARRLTWNEAVDCALEAQTECGEASTVKITLIGRPGRVVKRDSVVVASMYNLKRPALPKQLPKLSGADVETPYTIFIAAKQWRKVAEPIKNPEDALIVEGYCFLDPDVKGICVFAQSTTTKYLQRELREKQRAAAADQEA